VKNSCSVKLKNNQFTLTQKMKLHAVIWATLLVWTIEAMVLEKLAPGMKSFVLKGVSLLGYHLLHSPLMDEPLKTKHICVEEFSETYIKVNRNPRVKSQNHIVVS
jgi:hypothetical protein